mgnify:CR=1 FL=1
MTYPVKTAHYTATKTRRFVTIVEPGQLCGHAPTGDGLTYCVVEGDAAPENQFESRQQKLGGTKNRDFARHGRAAHDAALEGDVHFDSRVAARIEDFAADDAGDVTHGLQASGQNRRVSGGFEAVRLEALRLVPQRIERGEVACV